MLLMIVGAAQNEVIYLDYRTKSFYKETKKVNNIFIQLMIPIITAVLSVFF